MRTVYYPSGAYPAGRYVATIGFFDGVHLGHRHVIQRLLVLAKERGRQSMLITFERHPRQVLHSDWQPQQLTSLDEKADFLAKTGIDLLVVLRFDLSMAQLSARAFMEQVLSRDLHVDVLLTGYDNRFGHDRSEGFSDYVRYGRELGMEVLCADPFDLQSMRVSSSLVRRLLVDGRVAEASACLGRYYSLSGIVVHGEQIGRQLGFPTANLQLSEPERLIPAAGVYVVTVLVDGDTHSYLGVMNIGHRPTFEGHCRTLEVNILDFIGDLYGRRLTVSFMERLRDERHFDTPDELVRQMHLDVEQARQYYIQSNHQSQ